MPEGLGRDGLTVVGNLAVDRVDGRPPTPGGCPSFAALALSERRHGGAILTQRALADARLFSDAAEYCGVTTEILDAHATTGFNLDYVGEQRTMITTSIGDSWTPDKLADVPTRWLHLAPLHRSDFPLGTLQALRAAGHLVSYDGQGLVRAPTIGPMAVDNNYDPQLLTELTVLKLADDEAQIVAQGEFTEQHAQQLGVPEILITFGSAGADLYLAGAPPVHVAPRQRIDGVHTTGSGDMFSVAYASARAAGTAPTDAAQTACDLVSAVLGRRRAGEQI